jgi:hypothetical protein
MVEKAAQLLQKQAHLPAAVPAMVAPVPRVVRKIQDNFGISRQFSLGQGGFGGGMPPRGLEIARLCLFLRHIVHVSANFAWN